jgi:hypothetical protein
MSGVFKMAVKDDRCRGLAPDGAARRGLPKNVTKKTLTALHYQISFVD